MFDGLSNLLSGLKSASPQLLAGIAVACGFSVLAPDSLIQKLGLSEFVQHFRGYLGAGFVVSSAIVATQLVWWACDFALEPFRDRRLAKLREGLLSELTFDERVYLFAYIFEGENTQYFQIDDGVAEGLVTKGILYRATSVGTMTGGFAYNLQPWARRMLTANKELLMVDNSGAVDGS